MKKFTVNLQFNADRQTWNMESNGRHIGELCKDVDPMIGLTDKCRRYKLRVRQTKTKNATTSFTLEPCALNIWRWEYEKGITPFSCNVFMGQKPDQFLTSKFGSQKVFIRVNVEFGPKVSA